MKLVELLSEKFVQSSWLGDLEYDEETGEVIMKTSKNEKYKISGVPSLLYQIWMKQPSKGKFYHAKIKKKYKITKIK